MHHKKLDGDLEFNYMWHYLATGSGIHLNLGRTFILNGGHRLPEDWRQTLEGLSARGFDTVQMLRVYEEEYKYEIVDLRMPGHEGCFPSEQSHLFKSGWNAQQPCVCRPSNLLNCDDSIVRDGV